MADATILFAVREVPEGGGAGAGQLRRVRRELEGRGFDVRWAVTADDAQAVLRTEAGLAGAVVD
ncbi:hypothetical protein [Streptomyces olivoreticuli]|uniref:hypothetical protein n=1 Tax=Streptomyces olivoreticuli TaxID=68246 RepID=UPI003CC7C8F0